MNRTIPFLLCMVALNLPANPVRDVGELQFESIPEARFKVTGPVGGRIESNVENWLLRAPQSNPGMIDMFRARDRKPTPQLVPWAGEFVGKYLISAVLALRMEGDPAAHAEANGHDPAHASKSARDSHARLFLQVSNVVRSFIATQADDGYLGPFPFESRLLGNWDLWGHYHAMYGLLLWHQHTGDPAALAAARKAGDLVCHTYLGSGRRVFDAGDAEMNMSILTGMAMLHRATGEPRYLQMAREVEKDWERAGDYLRSGLDGREYFQSPRPRWESLHDLQGLVELWRITGDTRYRDAFIHHWRSIQRWDRRNTGAFSSGEQATGNPYAPSAIETCCTVAWMAITVDYLRLTGDSRAADELELSTLNGGLGAQNASGSWWTYNTPMDGFREASAHTIVFQARAGTPELNCCSVNGPRIPGLLSEWGVMSCTNGLVINSYLPGQFTVNRDGKALQIQLDKDYPCGNSQRVVIKSAPSAEWTLRLRIPAWSRNTGISASFPGVASRAAGGSYLDIRRRWKAGESITLDFDFALRSIAGANEASGKVSLYRGPILLAWDQASSGFDPDTIPPLNLPLIKTGSAKVTSPGGWSAPARTANNDQSGIWGIPRPWLQVDLPTDSGKTLRLVDFASAGTAGTHYRSWLSATKPPPPPASTRIPRDRERIGPGLVTFQWRTPRPSTNLAYRLEISADEQFSKILISTNLPGTGTTTVDLSSPTLAGVQNSTITATSTKCPLWWRVITVGGDSETLPDVIPAGFTLDRGAPPQVLPPIAKAGPNGELLQHSLRGTVAPQFGHLTSGTYQAQDATGTEVNGRDQMMVYAVPAWPEEDFTIALRVRVNEMPKGRLAQVFSAWTASMDDPLRITIEAGKLSARIESGQVFMTSGTPITAGTWHQVTLVKSGTTLGLFLDGQPAGSCAAPIFTTTTTQACALGGNPRFTGNEFLAATFADFSFWDHALSKAEIQSLAKP